MFGNVGLVLFLLYKFCYYYGFLDGGSILRNKMKYSKGPNNGVVLNKRVGWLFCLPFIGEHECLWEFF